MKTTTGMKDMRGVNDMKGVAVTKNDVRIKAKKGERERSPRN